MHKIIMAEVQQVLGGSLTAMDMLNISDVGALASVYAVTDLAIASLASAGMAVAEFIAVRSGKMPLIQVDRRLASMWFSTSLRPIGWQLPPQWDAVAGDYKASDHWIRLQYL